MNDDRISYQEKPVDLPVGFFAWLLDCRPVVGCGTCQAAWQNLTDAKAEGDDWGASGYAHKIREHHTGGHT
ncbi:hypothetical protein ABZV64_23790 [Streptomyces sp. NPDC004959]|uniref:hypothetical protein n=1 Tax=Streptomyces sp. NPDC004959 TaxID=3154673 RepID=UPI00339F5AA6